MSGYGRWDIEERCINKYISKGYDQVVAGGGCRVGPLNIKACKFGTEETDAMVGGKADGRGDIRF